ncbi:MAG: hypothetical protein ABIP51_19260 [Bacteroidia bacterium]
MKDLVYLLFVSFFIITVCPTVMIITCNKNMACKVSRVDINAKGSCEKENTEDGCPIKMCNSCQCCVCCFACTVENKKIEINVFAVNFINNSLADQFTLTGFTADQWQPPKTV